MTGVGSNSAKNQYVAGDFIDVFVFDPEANGGEGVGEFWERDVDGLFMNSNNVSMKTTTNTTIYGGDRHVFDVRLNQDKEYEIRFGDGIIGAKPPKNTRIIVLYLDTNGPDGEISLEDINF